MKSARERKGRKRIAAESFRRFLLLTVAFFGFCSLVMSQVDLYPFPNAEDIKIKKPRQEKPAEPFVQACSKKMQVPEKILTENFDKGFGRSELIRLILISKKSGKPLEELVSQREKGTRLSKIAEDARTDNKAVRKEANAILKELETELTKISLEDVKPATAAVAGISEIITKNRAADFEAADSSGPIRKTGKEP